MLLRRSWSLSGVALVLLAASAACSDAPPVAEESGELAASRESSDLAIRDQVARAAVFAYRCRGLEGDALESCGRDLTGADAWQGAVQAWSRNLDHGAICRALDAHRGRSHLYWVGGVDLDRVEREIVVDVTKREAAVFTYAASGVRNVIAKKVSAYQGVGYATGEQGGVLDVWPRKIAAGATLPSGVDLGGDAQGWTSAGGLSGTVALLDTPGVLGSFATVDGSVYEDGPQASKVATRSLSSSLAFIGHARATSASGESLRFEATRSAGLTAGGSTAAAILYAAGTRNPAALHAAIVAAAMGEIETHRGGDLDAYCGAETKPLAFRSRGGLAPLAGGAVPLPLADFPQPPPDASTTDTPTPDCSNDDELSCDALYPGQKQICAVNGAQHCCAAESPVTQLCQTDDDCRASGSKTAQCVQVQNAPTDGRAFSCREPSPARCTAIGNPRPGGRQRHLFVIRTKGFIAPITNETLGSLGGTVADAALYTFSAATNASFSEDPQDGSSTTNQYRLWAQVYLDVQCVGSTTQMQLTDAASDAGYEGPLKAEVDPLQTDYTTGGRFAFQAQGRPNKYAEPPFQAIQRRSNNTIWYKVEGGVRCDGNGNASLDLSNVTTTKFPSFRLWSTQQSGGRSAGEKRLVDRAQGNFSELWSLPAAPAF